MKLVLYRIEEGMVAHDSNFIIKKPARLKMQLQKSTNMTRINKQCLPLLAIIEVELRQRALVPLFSEFLPTPRNEFG